VKKNIKKLAHDNERQDTKFKLKKERMMRKVGDWEEALKEVKDRIELKQMRLQNKKNEEIKIRQQRRHLNEECDKMEFEITDQKRNNEQQKHENEYLQNLIKEAKKELRL